MKDLTAFQRNRRGIQEMPYGDLHDEPQLRKRDARHNHQRDPGEPSRRVVGPHHERAAGGKGSVVGCGNTRAVPAGARLSLMHMRQI